MRRAVAAAIVAALLLTGCATRPAEPAPTASAPPTSAPTTAPPTADATTAPAAAPPTCETLIAAQTVADFQGLGWEAREEPFFIGATQLPGGILCKWADPDGSGEGLQQFGWAPISEAQADAAQAELLAGGWRTIEDAGGTFVTESPETAFATGEQGYGLTYEFGDGWVIFADTKQSLLLIERRSA